jgi:outer membrane protein assembly factor BamB
MQSALLTMLAAIVLSVQSVSVFGVETAGKFDWGQWRGPHGDGVSTEGGWLTAWPAEGPKKLWSASVGIGCSSVAVSGGKLFTMGNSGKNGAKHDPANPDMDTVYCLDAATGVEVWKYSYPQPLEPVGFAGGPCVTPCVEGKCVYTLDKRGRAWCFDADSGKVVWDTDPQEKLDKSIMYGGYTASPLIEGNLLLWSGGALDKTTGKAVWETKHFCDKASPVVFTQGKNRGVAFTNAASVAALKISDGTPLWELKWPSNMASSDPIFSGENLFISTRTVGPQNSTALLQLGDAEPKVVWQNKNLGSYFYVRVLWQDHVYGYAESGDLKCIELNTGEVKWSTDKFKYGNAQVAIADGKLLITGGGFLAVAEASPAGYKELARTKAPSSTVAIVPVLCNGRIYCRGASGENNLVCFDVSGK